MKNTTSIRIVKPLKIALFGKKGLLGSQVEKILREVQALSQSGYASYPNGIELFAFDSSEMDITDHGKMKKFFDEVTPDFAINCTGYTNVDKAESEKSKAFALNTDALKIFIDLCKRFGTIFIHFSTDYVFDGRKTPPDGYTEKDVPNPLNTYGESKFLGEELIQNNMTRFFIVRTSWLFGPNGKNFVKTMLFLEQEVVSGKRDAIKVVNDQIGSPTYAVDLAKAVVTNFIEPFGSIGALGSIGSIEPFGSFGSIGSSPKSPELRPLSPTPPFGIYHLTNSGVCSWHTFASKILKHVKPISITSKEFITDAERPKNSILINSKLPKLRSWEDALSEYMNDLERV